MPDVIFNGPDGRLEGRYFHNKDPHAPIALVLHPHPQYGGTMNNKVSYTLFQEFKNRKFSVLRFNFRGVGRSQGEFDNGLGELSDAASALDWMQNLNADAAQCWIGGFSFGAWIGMQLLMRRPEISGFISVAPPANLYDFAFLAPCPASGLFLHGRDDDVVPEPEVAKLVERLRNQRGIAIGYETIAGAGHFFENDLDLVGERVGAYVDQALAASQAA